MSEPDDDASLPLVLACERCAAEFEPQQFGASTIHGVPLDARCPRCGSDLIMVDPN